MNSNRKTYSREPFSRYHPASRDYYDDIMSDDSSRDDLIINDTTSFSEDELVQVPMEVCEQVCDIKDNNKAVEQIHSTPDELPTSPASPGSPESPDRLPIEAEVETQRRALKSLKPNRMLNDIVIDYYINYVLANHNQSSRERIHVFSSFFFSKLKKLPNLCDSDARKLVQRWDKHVKIFDKDYLVIPICECAHWTLLIICFAHRILADSEDVIVIDHDRPRNNNPPVIFIFDSLGFKYLTKFTDSIRTFLTQRWLYERPNEERRNFTDRVKFVEINAKVPKQKNMVDCGVYILHYFEKFFSDPIRHYYRIRDGTDLSLVWSMDSFRKRSDIRKAISSSLESSKK